MRAVVRRGRPSGFSGAEPGAETEINMKHVLLALAMLSFTASGQATQQQDVPAAKIWFKYYSEHLPEAKQTLHECVAKGFDKVQGDERIRCEAARDAWHFQPYKPSKK
jgi:hypothetical protein